MRFECFGVYCHFSLAKITGSLTNASKMILWLGFTGGFFFRIFQNGFYRVLHLSAWDNFDSDAHFNVYMLKLKRSKD